MAHMEKQITIKQRGWQIETRDAGTCYVPGDVEPVPMIFAKGVPVFEHNGGCVDPGVRSDYTDPALFALLKQRLSCYITGFDVLRIEVVEGYFYRFSAPGYLDCTDWDFSTTIRDAREALKEDE